MLVTRATTAICTYFLVGIEIGQSSLLNILVACSIDHNCPSHAFVEGARQSSIGVNRIT